ncbi:MAG: Cof-type HAD-IIB family hydrolase [Bacteroidaceae bacterium]|nr:Cof-type HAD-IIB family hydrolase [Bacteroidaceae bacterium]
MIKAIFLDIDGTLVSFQTHRVPASTCQAIHEARQRGIKVFICTGRPIQFIDNLAGVEYDGMICVTGALCITDKHEVIYRNSIPRSDVQNLLEYLQQQGDNPTPYMAVSDEKIFGINKEHPAVQYILTHLNVPHVPFYPIEQMVDSPILQLIGFYTTEDDEKMQQILPNCVAMRWHPSFADIVVNGCSKADGIDKVIAHYGIDISETMGIGDGGNDIPMLQHAAIGVAMSNASPEVQQHADYITTSVDDDGIWNAFKHFELI